MPKHKLTEKHYAVLMAAQDGVSDFGPNVDPEGHVIALELFSIKFGEPMLEGVNSRTVAGLTKAGATALAAYLPKN